MKVVATGAGGAPPVPPAPARESTADGAGGRFSAVLGAVGRSGPAQPARITPGGKIGAPTSTTGRPATGHAEGDSTILRQTLDQVTRADARIDQVLRDAARGRSFTPAQLLALQAEVFRYSQTVEVISRTTDRLLGAVKQILNTQV